MASATKPWKELEGILLLVASAISYFMSTVFIQVITADHGVPSGQLLGFRGLYGLIYSSILVYRKGASLNIEKRYHFVTAIRIFAGVAGAYGINYGLSKTSLSDFLAVFFLNPFLAIILGRIVLKESMTKLQACTVTLSFMGVLLIVKPGFIFGTEESENSVYLLFALFGASTTAVLALVTRFTRSMYYAVPVFYVSVTNICTSMVSCAFVETSHSLTLYQFILITLSGTTSTLGQLTLSRGLQLEELGVGTPIGYLQVFFGLLFDSTVRGHPVDSLSVLGALVGMSCCTMLAFSKFKKNASSTSITASFPKNAGMQKLPSTEESTLEDEVQV